MRRIVAPASARCSWSRRQASGAELHAAELRPGDLKDALEHARAELATLQQEFNESWQQTAAAREEAATLRGQVVQREAEKTTPGVTTPVPAEKASTPTRTKVLAKPKAK